VTISAERERLLFYHYDVQRRLDGDPAGPPPPDSRCSGRNHDCPNNMDVISMRHGHARL
jgi:hypothetical protein